MASNLAPADTTETRLMRAVYPRQAWTRSEVSTV